MRYAGWIAVTAMVASALGSSDPALAESPDINAPAGTTARAAIAIARQTGTSIVVTDKVQGARPVPAIRGRMSADEAVRRLANASGLLAVRAGGNGWRLVPARHAARPTPPAPHPAASAPRPHVSPLDEVSAPDIVVLGSKRDMPLSDFPGQVEVVDGEDLAAGGVGGTEKIMQRVPTLSSTYLGSGRNKLFIRGIADSSFTGPTQSTVGQYLGDLRLSYNAPDPDLRLADLARVEVLEGPQGTLYGAGSLGGIVRLVPNDPDSGALALSGTIGGSATQHGALGGDASATANLPIARDLAALRVTLHAESQGGYIDKPLLGRNDVNRTGILGGRAVLRLELTPDWTIDLGGVGQTTHGRDSQYADRDGPPLSRGSVVTEGFDADFAQGQFAISGRIGDAQFKSTTGITGQVLEERYDATAPEGDPRLFVQRNDTTMVANETRLWQPLGAHTGWLIGTSYTHNQTALTRTLGAPDEQGAVTGVTNVIDEFTAYGEASLRLADGLVATAGARYTRTQLSGAGEDVSPMLALALREVTAERVEQTFLPSASIAAKLAPGTLMFIRYQEGFRPGGLAIAGDFVTRFRNDSIATFELGGRHGRPGSGAFDIAASVAHTRWRDIQADFIDAAGFPSTANIGDGRIWTATITAGAQVAPGLRVDAGITWNDSRIDEPSAALALLPPFGSDPVVLPAAIGSAVRPGADLTLAQRITHVPNIARISGRVGFDYRHALTARLDLTAQGWANYIGTSRLGVGPELGEPQGDYLDTGLNVRVGTGAMGVTLSLSNLTDEQGNRFALGTPFAIGRNQITPLRPRTIRIGIDAAF